MNDQERQKQRFTRLARACNEKDTKLATKLRREIDAAPREEPFDSYRRPEHTCCRGCRGC